MNKKRKKKLIISCLLLILLIGFNGVMLVNGLGVEFDGAGGGGGQSSGSCSKPEHWCFNYAGLGIRITLVDKDGKRVSGTSSYDVVGRPQNTSSGRKVYATSGQLTRKEATSSQFYSANAKGLDGFISYVGTINGEYVGNDSETWMGEIGKLFNCSDVSGSSRSCSSDFKKFKTYFDNVTSRLEKEKDSPTIYTDLDVLFKALKWKKSTKLSQDEIENVYILFEPTLATHLGKFKLKDDGGENWYDTNLLYGSITETAMYSTSIWQAAVGGNGSPGLKTTKEAAGFNPGGEGIGNLRDLTTGSGVAWIKLSDILKADSVDCYAAVKYINSKYSPDSSEYHKAIEGVVDGTYKWKDEKGNEYTIDKPYNDSYQYFFLKKENYEKREKMGKKASCYTPRVNCDTAIKFINEYSGLTVPSGDYDTAVSEVATGKYIYYASDVYETRDEDGNTVFHKPDYVVIDKAYLDREYLQKAKYGNGKASCNGKGLLCEEALAEIHSDTAKYGTTGSAKYNDNIAAVRGGTFSYETIEKDASGNDVTVVRKMDRAYPEHSNLLPANYGNGEASCDSNATTSCGTSALIKIDPCDSTASGYNYYKDSSNKKYWLECGTAFIKGGVEYSSDNTGHVAVETTNGGIVGNHEYCKLYCYEEFETNFPGKVKNVKAGQTFGWGQSGFRDDNTYGTIRIHKQCSNKKRTDAEGLDGDGYLYKKWENDYKTNEKNLIDGYIQKGAAEDARAKLDEQHLYGATRTCCQTETYSCKVGNRWTTCTRCKIWGYVGWAYSGQSHNNQDNSFEGSSNWSGASTQPASGRGSSACVLSYSEAENTARNQAYNQLTNQINSGASKSSSAKTKEPKLLEKIRQCTNNIKYVYKTVVTFSFEEPENHFYGSNDRMFSNHDELDVTPVNGTEGYNTANVNKSSCTTKRVPTYSCSGDRLSAKCVVASIENVLDCTQVTWDINGEWKYTYAAGEFEWYSLKTNNKLMNGTNKTGEGDEFFYSLGYGLPTAFTLPSGVYGDTDDTEMAVIVTNLGDHGEISDDTSVNKEKNYNTAEGHFAPVAESVNGGKGFKYQCTYEVDNDIFGYDCVYENGRLTSNSPKYCDKSKDNNPDGELVGIDVAYRLVSLLNTGDDINKAFPGQDGTGRRIGYNWNLEESVVTDILRSDIYQQDRNGRPNLAMYEIFLDVKKIQEIRQDSKNFAGSGDPYTSFENIKCAGDNQKYCASDFISELASTGPDATRLYGTCITDIDTQTRANNVLANGCNGTYTFPTINWVR